MLFRTNAVWPARFPVVATNADEDRGATKRQKSHSARNSWQSTWYLGQGHCTGTHWRPKPMLAAIVGGISGRVMADNMPPIGTRISAMMTDRVGNNSRNQAYSGQSASQVTSSINRRPRWSCLLAAIESDCPRVYSRRWKPCPTPSAIAVTGVGLGAASETAKVRRTRAGSIAMRP